MKRDDGFGNIIYTMELKNQQTICNMIFHEKVLNIQCYSSMNVSKDRHVAKGENI